MRSELLQLITKAIVFQYDLPNSEKGIQKTIFSTDNDKCYLSENMNDIVSIIYNSIVEYSFNEFDITENEYKNLHAIALQTKLKYNKSQPEEVKIKHGFFGEVLLYAILYVFFKSKPLISRGYFYNPLEAAETKGYDSYHLIENNNEVELWFGEVKFHKDHKSGIKSALENIEKAISDNYLERNILALTNHKNDFNFKKSKIETIINEWEKNPSISIMNEVKKHNMKLIYPVMIIYESNGNDYDSDIRKLPEYIAKKYTSKKFGLSIKHSIFFVLLPLKNVIKIKKEVIEWIESKKPLMS